RTEKSLRALFLCLRFAGIGNKAHCRWTSWCSSLPGAPFFRRRQAPAETSSTGRNEHQLDERGEPARPAQRLVQLQHLILQRHRGVPAQLADDALAQCFGGLRLAMHYKYPPWWTLEAGQPAHQFITVSMGREHGQLGDLGVDRHPVSVDLHLPGAFQQLATTGTGGLEAGEQQGIAVV